MCKNCYEEFVERSGKIMLFCRLLDSDEEIKNDMMRLCTCQRFCSDENKYIPHRQKEGCKKYKD